MAPRRDHGPLPTRLDRPVIFTLAGDHGVVAEGVSAYPQIVTAQMVENFLRGGAAVNVLARWAGAEVVVADVGVAGPLAAHPALRSIRIAPGTAQYDARPRDDSRRDARGGRGGHRARRGRARGGPRSGRHRRDGHREYDGGQRHGGGADRRRGRGRHRAGDRRGRGGPPAKGRRDLARPRGESTRCGRPARRARQGGRSRDRRPRRRHPGRAPRTRSRS